MTSLLMNPVVDVHCNGIHHPRFSRDHCCGEWRWDHNSQNKLGEGKVGPMREPLCFTPSILDSEKDHQHKYFCDLFVYLVQCEMCSRRFSRTCSVLERDKCARNLSQNEDDFKTRRKLAIVSILYRLRARGGWNLAPNMAPLIKQRGEGANAFPRFSHLCARALLGGDGHGRTSPRCKSKEYQIFERFD